VELVWVLASYTGLWRFHSSQFFWGEVISPRPRPQPGLHFIWLPPLDLAGMGGATRSLCSCQHSSLSQSTAMSCLFRSRLCFSWYQVSAIHGDADALATEELSCSRKGTPNTGLLHQVWSIKNSSLKGLRPWTGNAADWWHGCQLFAVLWGSSYVMGLSEGPMCRIRAQVESCYLQLRDVMGASDKTVLALLLWSQFHEKL
jgi:hypothetical protein